MTVGEKEDGLRILHRICLHYMQNIDLYDKDARMIVITALVQLQQEPTTPPIYRGSVSVSMNI